MKRHLFYCLILMLVVCGCEREISSPNQNYFISYYGGDGNQQGVDMVALNDGSFLLVGNFVISSVESQLYLLRVTGEGSILWEIQYGEPGEQWIARDVEPTNDGNFIIVADYRDPAVKADTDIKLVKLSPDGHVVAEAIHGTPGNDTGQSITPVADGGFIVTGATDSTRSFLVSGETDPDLSDAMNIRVDQNLVRHSKTEWLNSFVGYPNTDIAVRIFERTDGSFYVFGHTNSVLSGDLNKDRKMGLFYFRRDDDGGTGAVWYPGNIASASDTRISSVQSLPSFGGGYLVVGTSQTTIGNSQVFLARLRPTLTFQLPLEADAMLYTTLSLGGNIRGVAGAVSTSGAVGFLVLGDEVRTTGATNIWLSKVDQLGVVLWSTTIGSENYNDSGAAVIELPDGKIAILGTMELANNQSKMALIKLNREGNFLK